jgi:uncharacterized membrane protein
MITYKGTASTFVVPHAMAVTVVQGGEAAMDTGECYLGLGMLLGILVGAFFAYGNVRRENARRKIEALKGEKEKAKAIVDKAEARKKEGMREIPGAWFLILLAIVMAILTVYMLASADGLF